jgi:hypothetical protein
MTSQINVVIINAGGGLTNKTIKLNGKYASKIIGNVNNFSETNIDFDFIDIIRKECGLKKITEDFQVLHLFDKNSFPKSHKTVSGFEMDSDCKDIVIIFGKVNGKPGNENKYDFPPPIDNEIYYGNLCAVKVRESAIDTFENTNENESENVITKYLHLDDIDVKQWEHIYECLFGGFDDCDADNDEDEDDDDIYVQMPTTKNGYAKDGFVVDDDEDDDDDVWGSDEDDDEEFYLSDE